ncbi:transposase IS629 domain protein [Candidatus Erwinia dacicola]|uniref:Transposase IS629 domain protein n=1 Tax=Candidatus Erwinia dacicola TaxID=252393 RepID=A0A328TKI2_9GAMM|nr:transposase IS629 domain protein [Candidatus Erwinia dacicola]
MELATLDWVDWYNNRRLLGRLGYIPLLKLNYYASQLASEEAA